MQYVIMDFEFYSVFNSQPGSAHDVLIMNSVRYATLNWGNVNAREIWLLTYSTVTKQILPLFLRNLFWFLVYLRSYR